jgi:hypothetical protein
MAAAPQPQTPKGRAMTVKKRPIAFYFDSYRTLYEELGEMDELAAAVIISMRQTAKHIAITHAWMAPCWQGGWR